MASSRKLSSQELPSIDVHVLLEEAQQIKPRTACTAIIYQQFTEIYMHRTIICKAAVYVYRASPVARFERYLQLPNLYPQCLYYSGTL